MYKVREASSQETLAVAHVLSFSRCNHSAPGRPGGWRDSTSGSLARSHWVSSWPDPEKSHGREQEAQEPSDLLSASRGRETAKVLQWLGSALRSRLGGDYQPDPLVFRARNDSNFTNSKGLPGRVTMSTGEGFLPLVGVSSPSCCYGRFWTVCSLWGNLNSLATGKYLNSFKTTGIQQRKGKYPCGASVN